MTLPKIELNLSDAIELVTAAYPGHFDAPVALFGLRGFFDPPGENKRGIYDDVIGVVTRDIFLAVNANTDPSVTRKGIALLQDGVYDYVKGLHGIHHLDMSKLTDQKILHTLQETGKDVAPIAGRLLPYYALRQAGPVKILRDGSTTTQMDGWPAAPSYIDIHRGGYNTTSSEGCQTIHPDAWSTFFWGTVLPAMDKFNCPKVKYALLTKTA